MVPADLPDDLVFTHAAGGRHRAAHLDDLVARQKTKLRGAQKNCALDMAAVDVCLRDRRVDLLAALH